MKRLILDHTTPNIDESVFGGDNNWTDFYGNVAEEDPPRMPVPLGKPVIMSCFVDSDHAGNIVT